MKIDAHQHFWQFNPVRDAWITEGVMSAIRRDFMPDDLSPLLAQHGFDGCVAVQAAQSEVETAFLLDLAEKHDFIKGVVGWIDIKGNDLAERLDYFSQFPKLKGFRHILQGEKNIFMLSPKFLEGVRLLGQRGYTYDVLVHPNQLKFVQQLLFKSDNQRFVIDHMAKPYISKGLIKEWTKDLRVVARQKHVFCKISGMVTEADWQGGQDADFTPYLDVVFDLFGTDRIMYGSDWPVCLLAATYEKQLSIIQNYVSKLSDTEGAKIMGLNAAQFYNLTAESNLKNAVEIQ